MARHLPGVIVLLHDVAIHAGLWVAGEIGGTFGVMKRKDAQPQEYPCGTADYNNK